MITDTKPPLLEVERVVKHFDIAASGGRAGGTLRAVGFEIEEPGALPRMVTRVRELGGALSTAAV